MLERLHYKTKHVIKQLKIFQRNTLAQCLCFCMQFTDTVVDLRSQTNWLLNTNVYIGISPQITVDLNDLKSINVKQNIKPLRFSFLGQNVKHLYKLYTSCAVLWYDILAFLTISIMVSLQNRLYVQYHTLLPLKIRFDTTELYIFHPAVSDMRSV